MHRALTCPDGSSPIHPTLAPGGCRSTTARPACSSGMPAPSRPAGTIFGWRRGVRFPSSGSLDTAYTVPFVTGPMTLQGDRLVGRVRVDRTRGVSNWFLFVTGIASDGGRDVIANVWGVKLELQRLRLGLADRAVSSGYARSCRGRAEPHGPSRGPRGLRRRTYGPRLPRD